MTEVLKDSSKARSYPPAAETLFQRIRDRTARVGIVGLGYVGIPFAVEKAKIGYRVLGIDSNPIRVAKINQGENYISDVKDEDLRALVTQKLLMASTDFSRISEMDVIVIAVPTPLTRNMTPDLQYVESVTHSIAQGLRKGQLICLESTTYPGTTEEIIQPILEATGLKAEDDFFLVHSPERVDPGNKRYTTQNTNKVIGGVGPRSLEVGISFYSQAIEKMVPVSSSQAAELVKVFENTYRAVNIALVNELALLCDRIGLDVWEVLDAAFTKPFGIQPFYPGPGVGGHCIPIDPHYLEWKAKEVNFDTQFIRLAGEINRRMPEYVIQKAYRVLNDSRVAPRGAKILVMGVAYKKDLSDCRESPAIELIRQLQKDGVEVSYHDPFVPNLSDVKMDMQSQALTADWVKSQDLVLIASDHTGVDYRLMIENAKAVFDTRNILRRLGLDSPKASYL